MLIKKIKGLISLLRPELTLAAGICVLTGQVLANKGFPSLGTAILGFLCGFTLSAAALILNDVFDYEVDKINAPQRALPSGAVSPGEAIAFTGFVSLIGLSCAFFLGIPVLIVSVIFWIIGVLYNWRFKESGLPGNLMVSSSVAITFILGAMTVNDPWNKIVWVFSAFAFFIDLGEEIAGDAMDMAGDQQRGSRSLALLKGKTFALRFTTLCWFLVILISTIPIIFQWQGLAYLIMILVMDSLILYYGFRLLKSNIPQQGRAAMRGVYLGATVGLLGFLISLF
ncbi:MAG: UbiA family prenyltransferase [Anaerolineaceae bacterium]|nr:UbiA family prenyltransferase [Anaerolineaceae bacterium]